MKLNYVVTLRLLIGAQRLPVRLRNIRVLISNWWIIQYFLQESSSGEAHARPQKRMRKMIIARISQQMYTVFPVTACMLRRSKLHILNRRSKAHDGSCVSWFGSIGSIDGRIRQIVAKSAAAGSLDSLPVSLHRFRTDSPRSKCLDSNWSNLRWFDFDEAVRDPSATTKLAESCESPDNTHLDEAGYESLANSIDIKLFYP